MACDLCGKENAPFRIKVEGTTMSACGGCKSYGEIVREPVQKRTFQRSAPKTEKFIMISQGFGKKIKQARESRGLKQEELARLLKIKESQLHSFESEHHKPDIETAKLIGKTLAIRLLEEYEEEAEVRKSSQSGPMTIGDLLKR